MEHQHVSKWDIQNDELRLYTSEGVYGLSFLNDDVLRLRFNAGDMLKTEETFVVTQPYNVDAFELLSAPGQLKIHNSRLRVEVGLAPLTLQVYKAGLVPLLSTPTPGMSELQGDASIVRFLLDPDEEIYGLGQDPMARLNHRHQERRMWQEWGGWRRSGNAGIPFLMSNKGYGILLNSSWPARFAIGEAELPAPPPSIVDNWTPSPWGRQVSSGETHPNQLAILLDSGIMDIFIICREQFDDLLTYYVDLTGHAPMPPKWALGFMQCKNRYRSQAELMDIANEYRQRNIPCDVLIIDWLWFKEFGDLEWDNHNWPDPRAMLGELAQMGFHVLMAQHPFIDRNSLKYPEFKARGYLNQLPDETTRPTYDHSNPAARQAWWQEIRRLYQDGIRGYWTDMGELEVHPVGTHSHLGSRERVHNIYSLLWTQGLYENQRRDFDERVFSLPRTAYAGIQRNSAALWSGDISSSWEVLKDQVVIGQGVCLSGQQYWTTDIGGFMAHPDLSPELYIRWLQWGTFCPIFRTHGTRPDNEAWSFGAEAEKIITDFINLRYRLMPYIYSCARMVTETGRPIMRAMCLDFPEDPLARAQEHQFMFGPALLVAPVVDEGARTRCVYLPEGTWYDFWSGKKYTGRQWVNAPAPLSHIPLFVRAGSLIPMIPPAQHTNFDPPDEIEVHAYHGAQGSFTLYEDDGLSYAYEGGKYAKTLFTLDEQNQVTVEVISDQGKILPAGRSYLVISHTGSETSEPVTIDIDTNLSQAGICAIHLLVTNSSLIPAQIRAILHAPTGWTLSQSPASQEITVETHEHISWQIQPVAEALPLVHYARIECEIQQGETHSQISRSLRLGSGFATRWSIAGQFDNADKQGLMRTLPPETDQSLPYYQVGEQRISWSRNIPQEFNCFGYVDLRIAEPPNGHGVAFAKCKIWSDENVSGYIELSADPNLKLWLNNELVYRNPEIVLRQVLPNPVELKKGWNQVLVACAIAYEKPWSGREQGFNFRIVDSEGNLLEKILYSA